MNNITLDSCQYQSGVYMNTQRNEQSARLGHSNVRGLNNDTGESLRGSLGEVAAHVYFNLPFSFSVGKWKEADLITAKNAKVDCKTTLGDALFISPRHLHPDWYYLLIRQVDALSYDLLGYIKGADVLNNFTPRDIKGRNAPVYIISSDNLNPVPVYERN